MPDSPVLVFDSKSFLQQVTTHSGVYQMFDSTGEILYVGKAKNLKKRLASYFLKTTGLAPKTRALVSKIARIEVTVTHSEGDALLLEQNLIKSQRPPYNILLRDDKSYPYIIITSEDAYPRVSFHRGAKRKKARYFGPFPNVGAVKSSLNFIQKTFQIRQCEDSVFNNRTRPCLQYQIKRCTAPCVGYISQERYAEDIRHAEMFLQGKNEPLLHELADAMEHASTGLAFELAAFYRDQIASLRNVQSQQVIEGDHRDADVVAVAIKAGLVCVQVLYVRHGRILGSRSYYPQIGLGEDEEGVLAAFIPQFYLQNPEREIPARIIVPSQVADLSLISELLSRERGFQVQFHFPQRGAASQWLGIATQAAIENVSARLANKQTSAQRFDALQEVLGLEERPERIECFDISHSSGELTVASCVVFNEEGPLKSDYRRFNIEGITPGDDYGAMAQALHRRYLRLQKGEGVLPDILFIDGGKGQVGKAIEMLDELGVSGVNIIGVAKGTTRKAGFETLLLADSGRELVLPSDSAALHLIQHIRDESHRFAITGHRQRRDKRRKTSRLEDIPGIGAVRRRELLRHFGGLQEVQKASIEELSRVSGISKKMAEDIYSRFRSE